VSDSLEWLRDRLHELTRRGSPFADPVHEPGAHLVEPELVGALGFTEWTRDATLRHPRFLGLRDDRAAEEVVRERAGG